MNIKFRKPSISDCDKIVTWKYQGEYSFYDNYKTEAKKEWIRGLSSEENCYVLISEEDELIGHCSFSYDDGHLLLSVQMRPDLTGKGMGTEFVSAILEYGRDKCKFDMIELLVAKFNKRAIRVYEKLGFEIIEEFVCFVNGEEKEFYAMKKNF